MRMRRLLITLGTVAGCCAAVQHAGAAAPLSAPATPGSAAATPPLAAADAPPSSDFGTGWALQSSAVDKASGEVLSQPGFDTAGWQTTTVPNTVVGALVDTGNYPDPYFGMNLRGIPGTTYPIGERFTLMPTCRRTARSRVPWWYRKEFDLPAPGDGRSRLAALRRHQLPRQHLGERHAHRERPATSWAPSAATSSTSRACCTRRARTRSRSR